MALVVDAHAHFVPRSILDAARGGKAWYGLSLDVPGPDQVRLTHRGRTYVWGRTYWISPADRVAEIDARRVDVEILSMSGPLFGYSLERASALELAAEANAEVASYLAHAPERFVALATLPLQDPEASAAELERVMALEGFIGAVVGATAPRGPWNDEAYAPLLRTAERTGALLLIHPAPMEAVFGDARFGMRDLLGQPHEISIAWCEFSFGGILDRYPDLRVCFAQGGGVVAYLAGRLEFGARVRSDVPRTARSPSEYARACYYDTLTYDGRSLRLLLDVAGADRVLMGSDHPSHMSLSDPVGWIGSCPLTKEEKQAVLGLNATRSFPRARALASGGRGARDAAAERAVP